MTTNAFAEVALVIGGSTELSIVVKATVLLALGLGMGRLVRGTRASVRHVLLASTFGVLLALPVTAFLEPPVSVEIPISQVATPRPVGSVDQDIGAKNTIEMTGAVPQTGLGRISVWTLLGAGWAVGATLFLVPLLAALWRLRRVRASAMPWAEGKVLVERLAGEAGIRRPVAILLHEDIATPVTCGLVRPAIVLPLDARQWSDDDARHAFLHELEHVHRADWPVHVVARVVCALYWFHPFVWMAWRRLRLESERACDDAVLRVADPAAYADQLVILAQRLLAGGPRPLLSMANRSDLSVRVSAVLDANQPRGRASIGYLATTVCVAVVVLLAISAVGVVGRSRRSSDAIVSNQADPRGGNADATQPPRAPLSVSRDAAIRPTTVPKAATPQAQRQAPATGTAFVFISVKANRSGDKRYYPLEIGPDGRFVATNMPLDMLFRSAYQGLRIEGKPSWFNSERFDIEAQAEGNPTREKMWTMVRRLLADRFSVITHTETRIVPVYALVMAATDGPPGPQLRLSSCIGKDPLPPGPFHPSREREPPLPCGGIRIRTGSLQARWQTMEELASGLALMMGRNVLDQTGLSGKFDLEVEWTPAPGPPGPAAPGVGPATVTAIEERLGLRLEPQIGPVDYLVIDRVERPTEDR